MWFPKYKWIDKSKGILEVILTKGHEYEFTLSEKAIKHFNVDGCECFPEIIAELNILRANAENCLVHVIGGFDDDLW